MGFGGWTLDILFGRLEKARRGLLGLSLSLGISLSIRLGGCLWIPGWGRIRRLTSVIGRGGLGWMRRLGGWGSSATRFGTW